MVVRGGDDLTSDVVMSLQLSPGHPWSNRQQTTQSAPLDLRGEVKTIVAALAASTEVRSVTTGINEKEIIRP